MTDKSQDVSFRNVWRVGGTVIAFIIGSGFATGQEIFQFFTVYGTNSIWGLIIAALLLSITSGILIKFRYENKDNLELSPFYYFLGKIFGNVMRWFTPIYAFLINTVMISGAGAILNQYFGWPQWLGTLAMSIIVYLATSRDMSRLINILGTLGPLTIIFTIGIGLWAIINGNGDLSSANAFLASQEGLNYAAGNNSNWWLLGAFLYAAYTIAGAIPFVSSLGLEAQSKKESMAMGFFGGSGLMLGALVINIAMLMDIENIVQQEVPVLYIAEQIHPIFGFIFAFILLQETFSTSAPMVWTVIDAFKGFNFNKRQNNILILTINVLALIGAQLPFGELINIIYPFVGYFGLIIIVLVIGREIYDQYQLRKG